jgi:hypothetical protein
MVDRSRDPRRQGGRGGHLRNGGRRPLIAITQLPVRDPLLFLGAAFALIVSVVGFGLLLGLIIPNSNAINTYGGAAQDPH